MERDVPERTRPSGAFPEAGSFHMQKLPYTESGALLFSTGAVSAHSEVLFCLCSEWEHALALPDIPPTTFKPA